MSIFPKKLKTHWIGIVKQWGCFYPFIKVFMPAKDGKKKETEININ